MEQKLTYQALLASVERTRRSTLVSYNARIRAATIAATEFRTPTHQRRALLVIDRAIFRVAKILGRNRYPLNSEHGPFQASRRFVYLHQLREQVARL